MSNPLLEKEVEAFREVLTKTNIFPGNPVYSVIENSFKQSLDAMYQLARLEKAEMLKRIQAPLTAYQFSGEKEAVYVLVQINQAIVEEAKNLTPNQTQP